MLPTEYTVTCPHPPNREAALWRAGKLHAGIVADMVHLENNPFTLPEVQTLLDGITVGGHRVSDEEQVKHTSESWKLLLRLVRRDAFAIDKSTACALNDWAARNEAPQRGLFRDLPVSIAGTDWRPPDAERLDGLWADTVTASTQIADPFIRGMNLFLDMARNQFFFDGNKRTGRLMMNGVLLAAGWDVISVPGKRQQEFNECRLRFYASGEKQEMFAFLLSCYTAPYPDKPQLALPVSD